MQYLLKEKNYDNRFDFCGLNKNRLIELYRNGSITGKLVEDLICSEFNDYTKAKNSQDFYDVVNVSDNSKWEVRCLTKYGANLIPSSQIGAGRNYNEKDFFDKLDNINGYIIVDIRKFPLISYYKFGSWEAYNLFGRKITNIDFNKLINEI